MCTVGPLLKKHTTGTREIEKKNVFFGTRINHLYGKVDFPSKTGNIW